ncbi:MAG: ABC transporter ATP-binding protein [Micropruina sp.]|uniref:ABC transporter ATP-binding protein n=1 Tax=Micropruina sp. TaxID=2737536 RepID=UPI0039E60F96
MSAQPANAQPVSAQLIWDAQARRIPGGSRELLDGVLSLRGVLADQRPLFVTSVSLIVGMQLCAAAVSALTAYLSARIAVAHLDGIGLWVAVLAVSVVLLGVLTWLESWWSHVLAYRVLAKLRLVVHAAIGRIAPGGLAGRRTGEVAGAAVNDVEQLEWFYAHTAGASLAAVISPLLLVSVSVALVGAPALMLLAGLLLLLVPLWLLAPLQARQGEAVRTELSALKAETLEGAQGLRDLLTLNAMGRQIARVLRRTEALQRRRRAFNLRAGAESALADSVIAAAHLGMLAVLGGQVRAGALSPAVVPVAVVLVFHTFAPVTGVFAMWQRLGELAAAARRVHDVARAPSPVDDEATSPEPFDGRGTLELRGVEAGYGDTTVLRGVDLAIPEGQTVALVGASGAGKSTLAHLLVRFADPTGGGVRLGGRDLRSVDSDQVRRRVVLVPQAAYAMRGTLRSNLALARPDATDEAMIAALRQAALGELFDALPDGLDTPIGEGGATLSGGQLQRLSIARALLLDPAVLILDEPVAHLDALAEAELNAAVGALRRGRTTILIAHRTSTIRSADRVVLLEGGRVVVDGSHDDLLATSGAYTRLLTGEPEAQPGGAQSRCSSQ